MLAAGFERRVGSQSGLLHATASRLGCQGGGREIAILGQPALDGRIQGERLACLRYHRRKRKTHESKS